MTINNKYGQISRTKIIRIVQCILLCIVALILIVAAFPPNGWLYLEKTTFEARDNGPFYEYELTVEVGSNAFFDISDGRLAIMLTDEKRGSIQKVAEGSFESIDAGSLTEVTISGKLFGPTTMLILRDMIGDSGSVIDFKVDAAFGYLFGLIKGDLDFNIGVWLSYPGDSVHYSTVEDDDRVYAIEVSGLRQELIPADSSMTVTDGSDALHCIIRSDGSMLRMSVYSDDLDATIDELIASDPVLYVGDAETDVDGSTLKTFLSILDSMRGG